MSDSAWGGTRTDLELDGGNEWLIQQVKQRASLGAEDRPVGVRA